MKKKNLNMIICLKAANIIGGRHRTCCTSGGFGSIMVGFVAVFLAGLARTNSRESLSTKAKIHESNLFSLCLHVKFVIVVVVVVVSIVIVNIVVVIWLLMKNACNITIRKFWTRSQRANGFCDFQNLSHVPPNRASEPTAAEFFHL